MIDLRKSQRRLILDFPVRWNSTCLMLETALEYRGAFSLLQEHDPSYTSALTDTEWECTRFVTICHVHIQLTDGARARTNFSRALKMKAKFVKYSSKCSLALAVAAILDPQFKLKLVEYYYSQIYGSTALDRIKEVSDGLKELFDTQQW
ncbi:hypothetical protein ACFX2A_031671 [Malus domestica]